MTKKPTIKKTVTRSEYVKQEIPAIKAHPTPATFERVEDKVVCENGDYYFVTTFKKATPLYSVLPGPKGQTDLCDYGVDGGVLYRCDNVELN